MSKRTSEKPLEASVSAAQNTLNAIDWGKFWARVITDITPLAEANERIRAKSLEKAWKALR